MGSLGKRGEKGRNPGDTLDSGMWSPWVHSVAKMWRKGVCIWICWDQVGMAILHLINRSCITMTLKSLWEKLGRLREEDRLRQGGVSQEL